MAWREHINVLSHKANTTLAFFSVTLCFSHILKQTITCLNYVTPIVNTPLLSGILTLRHSQARNGTKNFLELRTWFVFNNHKPTCSVTNVLQSLHWLTLEGKTFLKVIFMFKNTKHCMVGYFHWVKLFVDFVGYLIHEKSQNFSYITKWLK